MLFRLLLVLFLPVFGVMSAEVEQSVLNLTKNYSFESGTESWWTPPWLINTQSPVFDDSTAVDGGKSIRFDVEAGKVIWLWQSFIVPKSVKEYRLSGWIRTESLVQTTPQLSVEIAFQGKANQYVHTAVTGKKQGEWVEYAADIKVPEKAIAIRPLLRANISGNSASGKLWFDAVQLSEIISPAEKLDIKEITPGNGCGIFVKDAEQPSFSVPLINYFNTTKQVELTVKVCDVYGKSAVEFKESLELPACDGVLYSKTLENFQEGNGFYSISMEMKGDHFSANRIGSFLMFSPVEKRDPFYGFTSYGAPEIQVRAMAKLGAGTAGLVFSRKQELTPGYYNWQESDERYKLYRELDYQIIGGIYVGGYHKDLHPKWLLDQVKANLDAGKKFPFDEGYFKSAAGFISAAAERYRDGIHEYSAIEEIDLAQHMQPFEHDHYVEMVKTMYRTLKKVDQKIHMSGIGVAGPDFAATPPMSGVKHFMKLLHDYVDSIGYDYYVTPNVFGPGRHRPSPEKSGFREKLLETVKISKQYGKSKFAIDEAGYCMVSSVNVNDPEAIAQAAVLLRSFIIARSVPEMSHWLYFKLAKGAAAEDWSLWDNQCAPMPALAAYATAASRLAFVSNPEVVSLHEDIYSYLFTRDDKEILALWSTAPEQIAFAMVMPNDFDQYDFMNNRSSGAKGKQGFMLNEKPIFLELSSTRDQVRAAVKQAKFTLPEVNADFQFGQSGSLQVTVKNQTQKMLPLELAVGDIKSKVTLQPSEQKKVLLDTRLGGDREEVNLQVKTGEYTYQFRKVLELTKLQRLSGKFSASAGLNEFKSLDPVAVLDSSEHLYPVDAMANRLWTGPEDLSARVYLAYDQNNFYIGVETTDDIKVNTVSGSRIWSNDSLQFAINPGGDAPGNVQRYGPNDFEFAIAKTPEGPQLYCYSAPDRTGMRNKLVTSIPFTVKDSGPNTTVYKVAIPWKLLGTNFQPGMIIGFNLIALDTDDPAVRANYWMGITDGIAGGKKPWLFRKFMIGD